MKQASGDGSTSAQAGRDLIVVQGNSLSEVQEFVREAIAANALEMRKVAAEVFDERVGLFSEKLVERAVDNPELVSATSDPDMQSVLIDAGLGFARSGDEDLADILVDFLADRSKEEPRSLLAVVINDAVVTAPKLTDGEIAILTLYWRLVLTVNHAVNSPQALADFVRTDIVPLVPFLPRGEASYLHLQSLGCAIDQVMSAPFSTLWSSAYNALFTRGFAEADIPEDIYQAIMDSSLTMPHMRDPSLLQFSALNSEILSDMAKGTPAEVHLSEIDSFMQSRSMDAAEVETLLGEIDPRMVELAELWEVTPMKSLRLSAVGIAIAHANWRHLTGGTSPLSIWISDEGPSQ